jgi:uncharacterized protein (DUF427 family)
MDPRMKVPGPDHPITIEPTTTHVTVKSNGQDVAETRSPLALREASYPVAYYVPLSDVDPSVLRPSSTTSYCPFKGEASYYDLVVGDDSAGGPPSLIVKDAIWTYEKPYDAVAEIAGHVAFYADRVELTVDA